jgi:two-component system, cell cycle response regulator
MSLAHILLVEDTLTQALMMEHILQSNNFQVSIVKDGQKALTFLTTQKPDLIVSDISMPEVDGYELCRRVKEDPKTRGIPFVLLSSFHDATEIVKVVNSGADSFMLKRFDQQYVIENLNNVLANCVSEPSSDKISIKYNQVDYSLSSDPQRLISMLLSAFKTVVHLIPLVKDD